MPKKSEILLNRIGLPKPFVNAIKAIRAQYSKGDADFSATELMSPPRIVRLKELHGDEIQEDVADMLPSFAGSINHFILDQHAGEGKDTRYYAKYGKYTVSGAVDYQEDGTVTDYKFTTITKALYRDFVPYKKQLNIYYDLLKKNGHEPKKLQTVLVFNDWKPVHPGNRDKWPFKTKDYPKERAMIVPIVIKKHPITEDYINHRIELQIGARTLLPHCTKEERFENNGFRHRCRHYCEVSSFCDQYKEHLKDVGEA